MFAVKRIELRVVRSAVLRAEPPAPIAALRRQKRLVGILSAGFCGCAGPSLLVCINGARISVTGVPEEFPGRNVFLVANPNVKIGVNPGSGKNSRSRRNFSSAGDGFACRERAEVRVGFDAAVEFA